LLFFFAAVTDAVTDNVAGLNQLQEQYGYKFSGKNDAASQKDKGVKNDASSQEKFNSKRDGGVVGLVTGLIGGGSQDSMHGSDGYPRTTSDEKSKSKRYAKGEFLAT
jgi:hypothetical protein